MIVLVDPSQADDADEPNTPNSQIVYGLQPSRFSDNFTIDPDTGVLRNKGVLDREALDPDVNGKIELNVTATDRGTPPLSDIAKVIIELQVKTLQACLNTFNSLLWSLVTRANCFSWSRMSMTTPQSLMIPHTRFQ